MINLNNKILKSVLSVTAALVFCFTSFPTGTVNGAETKSNQSLSEQRAQLEEKLSSVEKKLNSLSSESQDTQEYIDVLDEKIGYLNEQYELTESEVSSVESKIDEIENSISSNTMAIENINIQIDYLQSDLKNLQSDFIAAYEQFCERMHAIYISGNGINTLAFLLSSNGIAELYTRYEMVSAVSQRDSALMKTVETQCKNIVETSQKLDEKQKKLEKSTKTLSENQKSLKTQKVTLLEKQDSLKQQDDEIKSQQQQANTLLQSLHEKTKEYGEYRDITQEQLDEIDAQIEEADKKYPVVTTTTTTKTTTEKKTTTKKNGGGSDSSTTKKTTTTTTAPATSASDSKYLSLTYPCPKYTKITCGFGAYSGHTGCDFSTYGNENQKIVAAESGTVILVRLLERSYGHYVVIRHDKTTSSGKSAYTLYAHNNDILVSEGQYVTKGQQIAKSGTTGNSTGPHCHFELRLGGSSQSYAVNPANYLP